jgi:hypothetical protein
MWRSRPNTFTAAVGFSMLRSARRETCGWSVALTPSRMDARDRAVYSKRS